MHFLRFRAATRISRVNCAKMAENRAKPHAYMKFSALNVDFGSPSPNPIGSRRVAQAGIKKGTLLKSGYLFVVGLSSVKIVADRQRHAAAAYYNKHWRRASCQRQ